MERGFNGVRQDQGHVDKEVEGMKEQSERDTKLELRVCQKKMSRQKPFDLHRLVSPQGPTGKTKSEAKSATIASELLNKASCEF